MVNPRLSVVVLNWNGWRDTIQCVESLLDPVLRGLARLIVVDNSSTDESVNKIRDYLKRSGIPFLQIDEEEIDDLLRVEIPAMVLLTAKRNGGYAAGNNLGIRLSLKIVDLEYIWVLNNDTTVEPGSVEALIRCADSNPQVGIWGSTLIEEAGSLRIAGGARYYPLLTISKRVIIKATQKGSANPKLDYISGAAMLLSRKMIEKVGLLAEEYFLFFEELDYTCRVKRAGYTISWCPKSVVYHTHGRSAGSRSGKNQNKSRLAEYHSNLSCLIFQRKFYGGSFFAAALTRLMLKVGFLLWRRESAGLGSLLAAYRDYFVKTGNAREGLWRQ